MIKTTTFLTEHTDFSLVQGGPLFQLLLRTGLVKPSMDLLARRIIVVTAIAWLPLLLLTLMSGHAVRGLGVPFLVDLGAHVRLLLCVPLFLAAEVIVHRLIKATVLQFLERDIIAPQDRPRFESVVTAAMRLRNSVPAEVIVFALAIASGIWIAPRYLALDIPTWYAVPSSNSTQLTAAGFWYVFISLTIFRILWLRWYFRLFIWYRFLWQVSRNVTLQLNALHPDRAGGLGFLAYSAFAFTPVLLAHTIGLAGILGGKIWHEAATLLQFKLEIVAWMIFLLLLALTPLFFFVTHLAAAKRAGMREYGRVASRYVADFHRKWIDGRAQTDESFIGSADIQSLADLGNSFDVVREMSIVPFGRAMVLHLAVLTALPLTPLLLTMIPLEQLIDRALSVIF